MLAADASAPAADASGHPQTGGTITVARSLDAVSLDPHKISDGGSGRIIDLIYDTLFVLDYDYNIAPGLATDWTVSPDGKTYTIELQPGVRFWSGKELTSEDVKYTIERWQAYPSSPTSIAVAPISEVETPDDHTVILHLENPTNLLLENLAEMNASILNSEFTPQQGDDYGISPATVDGTGPWILREWVAGDHITLERNDEYGWGSPAWDNQGPPRLEQMIIRVIPESATRFAEIQTGGIQVNLETAAQDIPQLEQSPNVQLQSYIIPGIYYIGLNTAKAPLDDPAVRRAVNLAIDKEELAAGGFGGQLIPEDGPYPAALPGALPDAADIAPQHDPAAAAALLDEAGWTLGDDGLRAKDGQTLRLSLYTRPTPYMDIVPAVVQGQLRDVGIDVSLTQLETSAMLEALAAGDHDMYILNYVSTNPDQLYAFFDSSQLPSPNRVGWNDPATDEAFLMAHTSPTFAESIPYYQDVQRIIIENDVWVNLGSLRATAALADDLHLRVHPRRELYKGVEPWLEQ